MSGHGFSVKDAANGSIPVNSTAFLIEVAKGNVKGHTSVFKVAESTVIGTSFGTFWDIATDFIWPTSGETWEILSSSSDDDGSPAGIGAQTVLISGLDDSFNPQTEIITMNGTNAVTTTRTDWFRIDTILVTLSGSSEGNVGTITLRVSGGGNVRATMLPTAARSFNGFLTVPAGKSLIFVNIAVFTPKGEDNTMTPFTRAFGSNTFFSGGITPTYQATIDLNLPTLPLLPEKTDLEFKMKSTNAVVTGSMAMQFIEIDNNLLNKG